MEDDNDIILAMDSIGSNITNRGQYIRDKWNILNKKRHLKIHIDQIYSG